MYEVICAKSEKYCSSRGNSLANISHSCEALLVFSKIVLVRRAAILTDDPADVYVYCAWSLFKFQNKKLLLAGSADGPSALSAQRELIWCYGPLEWMETTSRPRGRGGMGRPRSQHY